MDQKVLEALNYLNPADLSYTEWVNVGMALKAEGYDVALWDGWSKNDSRYKRGECDRKWRSFRGSGNPVSAGTIVQMAKDRGWQYFGEDWCLDWTDEISEDGERYVSNASVKESMPVLTNWNPAKDLLTYLKTLFRPDEYVGYVTNDVWEDGNGKWVPARGAFDRTAAELIEGIEKYPNDLGAVLGDSKSGVGAWIRFNPVDGKGVRNENITRFAYALVESDSIPVEEQYRLLMEHELPIACLVHSGGKSLHAIVRVDAPDADEYRKRVEFLYSFLGEHGFPVDVQNKNPSRLSRMPGVTRDGNRQYLVAVNIGKKTWADWMDFAEGIADDLPDVVSLADYKDGAPELPEELIEGILRRGHKMLISGSSKAGKSFLLMELCIAIAEGKKWLGFSCKKGRVLYVNLEIDPASAINRFINIYEELGYAGEHMADIEIWNLRGHAIPLDQLVPKLIRKTRDQHFDAIIIDPIYKVITGDENNASEMGAFCNQFDRICNETGCATIYCHHHSKGAQGAKRAMDRASGSGVFARDPDAQLDMIELELTSEMKGSVQDNGASAWRLESSLREFQNIVPVNFWFEYPIHRIDTTGELAKANAEGSPLANLAKSSKRTSEDQRKEILDHSYDICCEHGMASLTAMAEFQGINVKTMRRYAKEFPDEYLVENGMITRKQQE